MNRSHARGVRARTYEKLKQDVIEGKLRPGTRLREVELAGNMGVSRTPVREALARLEEERLVAPITPRGYKVAELSNQHIEEVLGLREVLEAYAGALATPRIASEDIEKLESILKQSEQQFERESGESLLELNTRFHETITKASGNTLLLSFLEQLNNNILRYRALLIEQRTLFPETILEHRRILNFLKKRDQQSVREAISDHVRKTKEKLLSICRSILT